MKPAATEPVRKKPSLAYALFALFGVLGIILGATKVVNAPIHLMFFVIWLFVIPVSMHLGYSYNEINDAMMENCKKGLGPILLLMAVGAVIATWIACGAVPAIIYIGLKLIRPNIFLLAAFLLCVMVSLACGTSWATAGTAGLAMFAIGESMGVPSGMTVGAIISGSFLGDMLSPMSDSTNVAAAAVETDLITHCKQLSYVVLPSFLLTGAIYYVLGLRFANDAFDDSYLQSICTSLSSYFHISFVAFIPVIVLLALLVLKKPAVPSMLVSSLVACLVAVLYQGVELNNILPYMWSGYSITTGQEFLDKLLNRGGVTSMFNTGMLMLYAFGMVGAYNLTGILDAIISPVAAWANTVLKLTFASEAIALIGNIMGTNTFSLLMSGSLMIPAYRKFHLHPTNCSKAINATSTVIAPLIPWNIVGMYIDGLFGVSTLAFAPYSFLCYITPVVAFLMVLFNYRVIPDSVDLEHGEKYISPRKAKKTAA